MFLGRKFNERVKQILADPAFYKPISELNKKAKVEVPRNLIITIKTQLQWRSN